MIVVGGLRNWHWEVTLSFKLIDTFLQAAEKQANESINTYRTCRENGALETYDLSGVWNSDEESEAYSRIVEVHQGLDSETWDLNELFKEYFPSLHRRSALLTLWGFVEHELNHLCWLYQKEKSFQLSSHDLSGRGIVRSSNYLEKVVELKGLGISPEWDQLKKLQLIRNCIAHNDGKLSDRDGKVKNELVTAIKKVGFASGEREIVLEEGFLSRAADICEAYFSLVGRAIKHRETNKISTSGIPPSQ